VPRRGSRDPARFRGGALGPRTPGMEAPESWGIPLARTLQPQGERLSEEEPMRRVKQVLQYLIILAVFAAIGFIPLEKPRSPQAGSGPQASVRTTCR
jgi:hypothetical protein